MVSSNVDERTLERIKVAAIRLNPDNPRGPSVAANDPRFEALRESVAKFGILVPLVVQKMDDGAYRLINGERRYHVAKSLRIDEVPAIVVHQNIDTERARQIMFQIHMNWSPWDAAMQCHALEGMYSELVKEHDGDEKQIIQQLSLRTGDDTRTIRNRVQFLRWPESIRHDVYAHKHNAYWYIVEIEDKIVEPALRNFPEYFEVVRPVDVRSLLFKKFEEGLVRAGVEVRRAAVIARTQVPPERRQEAISILDRLVKELDYSFEEAREDFLAVFPDTEQEPAPSPRTVLTSLRKVRDTLDAFSTGSMENATGRSRVDKADMVQAVSELVVALDRLKQELES